tara:strand:- start:62 stop:535 length:474 start_codon:yes stop_codon:yes gene_type:complete
MVGAIKLIKRMIVRTFFLILITLLLTNCSTTNHTKTEKKILDYESSGSVLNALSLGVPGAAILFLTVDINNYLKFNLNEKEIKMHTDAIQIALNNTPNGKIVSWHNGDRLSSGKVRVVKTYYKNDRYCRIFQSYIKLNGAKKHNTKHVCKVNNVWKF